MAKFEREIYEDLDSLTERIEKGILGGSMTASLEDGSDFRSGDARCSVRVFERYSYTGGNRLSLSVTLFQQGDGPVKLSAITSGGSSARFFKINTWGEEAFLDKLSELLDGRDDI
jgi:hypothetical protein